MVLERITHSKERRRESDEINSMFESIRNLMPDAGVFVESATLPGALRSNGSDYLSYLGGNVISQSAEPMAVRVIQGESPLIELTDKDRNLHVKFNGSYRMTGVSLILDRRSIDLVVNSYKWYSQSEKLDPKQVLEVLEKDLDKGRKTWKESLRDERGQFMAQIGVDGTKDIFFSVSTMLSRMGSYVWGARVPEYGVEDEGHVLAFTSRSVDQAFAAKLDNNLNTTGRYSSSFKVEEPRKGDGVYEITRNGKTVEVRTATSARSDGGVGVMERDFLKFMSGELSHSYSSNISSATLVQAQGKHADIFKTS